MHRAVPHTEAISPARGRSPRRALSVFVAALALATSALPGGAEPSGDVGGTALSASASVSVDATAVMRRVAAGFERNVSGVVAVRSHSELTISAPFFGRHIVSDDWFVFENGALAASSQKSDPRRPPLHDPYREQYLGEYEFHRVACAACPPHTTTIAYESTARDVAHAYGTLLVDDATARIVSTIETPYKLPWPTKRGSLDARWGDAAGGWFPLEIDGAFVGGVGPFVGHARYAQELARYDRYPSVAAATAELARTTGRAPVAQN